MPITGVEPRTTRDHAHGIGPIAAGCVVLDLRGRIAGRIDAGTQPAALHRALLSMPDRKAGVAVLVLRRGPIMEYRQIVDIR
jgi:hypothetical protein